MSISIEIKENNEQYASVDYWNERYTNEVEYDWLGDYNIFKELIHRHVSKSERILMVGCGNSKLSEQMFKDGYENIVSTDYSEVCIANQKKAFPHLTWQVADLMNLKDFIDESFDVVIEKATLDALLVGEKSPWHPSDGLNFISPFSCSPDPNGPIQQPISKLCTNLDFHDVFIQSDYLNLTKK